MLSIQKAQTDNDFLAIADLADDIWHEQYKYVEKSRKEFSYEYYKN